MLREGQVRIPSGCALSGIMSRNGSRFSGEEIIKSIVLMHDRSNGLGGGFAAYGIYPQFKEYAEKNNNVFCIPDMAKAEAEFSGIDGTDMNYRGIELHVPLSGKHQVSNAVTAIEMALALNKHTLFHIAKSDIISGIGNTKLPARQEVLRRHPLIILDGAHNIDGIKTLAGSIQANLSGRKIVAVMGMLKDKDYEESIGMIAGLCSNFIAVKPDNPRALNVAAAAEEAKKYCAKVAACDDYAAAVKLALQYAGEDGAIVICGSLYLAGPMRNIVLNYFKSL